MIKLLRKGKYCIVFITFPSPGFYYPLATYLSRIPLRIGHEYKLRNKISHLFLTHHVKLSYDHEINLNLDLQKKVNLEIRNFYPFLPKNEHFLDNNFIRIGIHTGSSNGMELKRWGNDKFILLCKKIFENHSNVIISFFGTCSDEFNMDEKLKEKYAKQLNDYVGTLSIRDTINKISDCNLFISNDSGLMHIANALGLNIIAIFGPTDEKITGPINNKINKIIIIRSEQKCKCFYVPGTNLLNMKCNFLKPCLTEITVDQVYNATLTVIEKLNTKKTKFERV